MLGHTNIIESIITTTYDTEFKNNFISKKNSAMELSFGLKIDYDKEDGYRHLIIRLFGTGYVTVLSNETWIIAKANDMHVIKPDGELETPKYDEGQTGWKFWGSHDSCWRDFIHKILYEYADKLSSISTIKNWYKTIDLTDEELAIYRELEKQTRK